MITPVAPATSPTAPIASQLTGYSRRSTDRAPAPTSSSRPDVQSIGAQEWDAILEKLEVCCSDDSAAATDQASVNHLE